MKSINGVLQSPVYLNFMITTLESDFDSSIQDWSPKCDLQRGTAQFKGWFKATKGAEIKFSGIEVEYKDIVDKIVFSLYENNTYPLIKLSVPLMQPEKLTVTEFFILGHFCFKTVNVISKHKIIDGLLINKELEKGKKINVLGKLIIERMGDPLAIEKRISTSEGDIVQLKTKPSNIEI